MLNRLKKGLLVLLFSILTLTPCQAMPAFNPDEGVYIIEENSGDVIFSQNEDQPFEPASTTKLMTALILLENIQDLNQPVICGTEVLDYDWNDSEAGLWENQQTNYLELLYCMLLPSGNDAAGTIAVNVGRVLLNNPSADKVTAQARFVEEMNNKAEELGLTNTHFTNPAGQDDPNHYTTPKDFAKVVNEAYKNDLIVQISRTLSYPITSIKGFTYNLSNTNSILYPTNADLGITPDPTLSPEQQALFMTQPNYLYSPLLKAGKTGTTGTNSRTFVFRSDQEDANIIGVLFNTPGANIFTQSKSIMEELNNNYSLKPIENLNGEISINNTQINSGNTLSYNIGSNNLIYSDYNPIDDSLYSIRWNPNYITQDNDNLTLINDINEGDKVGSVLVSVNNHIKTVPIYSNNNLKVYSERDSLLYSLIFIFIILNCQVFIVYIVKKFRKKRNILKLNGSLS